MKSSSFLVLTILMKEEDTIYRVFRTLPDFIRDRHILLTRAENSPEKPEPPKTAVSNGNDFLLAMKDVKPIGEGNGRIPERARRGIPRTDRRAGDPDMYGTLRGGEAFNVVNLPEYMEGYVEGTNPLTLEKIRRGEYSIQRVLDLHGLSAQEAKESFEAFIDDALRKQVRCVKVIHGRGLKSRNGPVLKEKLKEWIVRAMHRKWVVAFCSSQMTDGGPGATVVLLRSKAKKRRLRIIG